MMRNVGHRPGATWGLCWSMLVLLSIPMGVTAGQADPALGRLEHVRDQGILYLKKGRYKPALKRLSTVYADPRGAQDFRTVYARGRAAFGVHRIQIAFEMAFAARSLADSKRRLSRVQAFVAELSAEYGAVDFRAAPGETRYQGRILLERQSTIINKNKKNVFDAVRSQLRSEDVRLPIRMYLPFGRYIANNIPFEIEHGEKTPVVDLFLQVADNTRANESAMWWYLGVGGATAVVVGLTTLMILDEPEPEYRDVLRLEAR